MCKEERCDVMEAFKDLPDDKKQFMLGYAAGISASTKPAEQPAKPEDKAS